MHRAVPRAAAVVAAVTLAATVTPVATSAAGAQPALHLVRASRTVSVERYPGEPAYFYDLGVYVAAGDQPVEIWARRRSYRDPVRATITTGTGRDRRTTPLPAGLADLGGLQNLLHVTVTDAAGKVVASGDEAVCPDNDYGAVRTGPTVPTTNPYPTPSCYGFPFGLTSLFAWQSGWASPYYPQRVALPEDAADGTYTVTAAISPTWRAALRVPAAQASVSVQVELSTVTDDGEGHGMARASGTSRRPVTEGAGVDVPDGLRGHVDGTLARASARGRDQRTPQVLGSPGRPVAPSNVPDSVRPDLRAIPAFGVTVLSPEEAAEAGGEPGHEYLAFSATVWNAGPSPMVVDGYRRDGQDLMDAYQSFYDAKGNPAGYTRTGTLEFDDRHGHEHWHFTDFATYRLLVPGGSAIRSEKEAFCLAPTDAVDLSVPGAQWKPGQTGLETACGWKSSLSIRETLHTGWGDTYGQYRPGQSFDITDLPNGPYDIQVIANPDGRLLERTTSNNETRRRVVLGGTPGARTVTVPPYQGIDAP